MHLIEYGVLDLDWDLRSGIKEGTKFCDKTTWKQQIRTSKIEKDRSDDKKNLFWRKKGNCKFLYHF